ncbi:MAG: hypothetical protein CBD74_04800 [Saprospirales bacterium TMED214]|nr:MAG: hypothetical protein CBD74_04800 [Saprospirales bacterium TMED214]
MVHIRDYQIPWVGLKNGEHNFHFEIDESFFTYFDHAEIKRCDIHIDLKFQKSEHLFILKFEIDGWLELPCDRCLAPYEQSLFDDAEVWVKFANNRGEGENADEADCVYIARTDPFLDVSKIIYDYILLAIPLGHFHQKIEHCDQTMVSQGSSKVGNKASEKADETDPRWDALKKLQSKK